MYSSVWRDQVYLSFVDFAMRRQEEILRLGIFAMPPLIPVPLPMKGNLNYTY